MYGCVCVFIFLGIILIQIKSTGMLPILYESTLIVIGCLSVWQIKLSFLSPLILSPKCGIFISLPSSSFSHTCMFRHSPLVPISFSSNHKTSSFCISNLSPPYFTTAPPYLPPRLFSQKLCFYHQGLWYLHFVM